MCCFTKNGWARQSRLQKIETTDTCVQKHCRCRHGWKVTTSHRSLVFVSELSYVYSQVPPKALLIKKNFPETPPQKLLLMAETQKFREGGSLGLVVYPTVICWRFYTSKQWLCWDFSTINSMIGVFCFAMMGPLGEDGDLLTQDQAMRSSETPKATCTNSAQPTEVVMGSVGVMRPSSEWLCLEEGRRRSRGTRKRTENEKRVARWFKPWPFSSPSLRWRETIEKGHINIPKRSRIESPGDAWFGETPLLSEIQRFQKKKALKSWNSKKPFAWTMKTLDLKKWYDCMMQIQNHSAKW